MRDSSVNILFQLLRAALGNEVAVGELSSDIDWQEVIDLSFDQGVAAIAVDGLGFAHDNDTLRYDDDNDDGLELRGESLELELDSPELEDLKYEWFGEVFAREEDYGQQMGAIRKLVGLWSAAGLDTFALKGLAFAQYYPVPEHRYSCDFDCNVRSADGRPAWAEADRIARENEIEVDDSMNKHSRYVVAGLSVENHRNIISVNGSRKDKRFDAYLQGLLCASEKCLLSDVKLYSPCWLFNALFCVAHARTHFIEEEGITLKHVLDWVLIRRAPEAATCREQFEKDIDRFGLRKFFDALDGVGDVLLASPTKTMVRPLRPAQEPAHQPTKTGAEAGSGGRLTESQRLMLEDILAPKQVRHFESRFLAHLNILRMLWTNRWKFRLYSETSLFTTVFHYIYGHFFDSDVIDK